jgi:MarR family transcriptional regulator, organic hydroperoxide resistance regulator
MSARAKIPQLGASLEFLQVLWALDHRLQAASKWMRIHVGVTSPQRLVLRLLGLRSELTPGEVAALLHVDPSTLTGVLQRLERHGLVQRRPDPHDARRARLRLTERGRHLETAAAGTVEAAVGRALARLPQTSITHARRTLQVLAEELARR